VTSDNPFHPFEDRLAFEFADYHFFQQESLELSINKALQLWAAQSAKHGHDNIPWKSAVEMYSTIDWIQQGNNPWKSVPFYYKGPMPDKPSKWMTEKYMLVTHNIHHLLYEQIACTNFDGHWDYVLFKEFNQARNCIWTNIMPGNWAAKQAVHVLYLSVTQSQQIHRMRSPRIHQTMEPCLLVLLPEVIKQSHQLQLVIKNSIQYILAQETLTIQLDMLMALGSYHVPFFPFQKV